MKTPPRKPDIKITVYLGRNNPFFIAPKWAGVALTAEEMAEITRVDIKYKDVIISSGTHPDLIDFTTFAALDRPMIYFDLAGLDLEVGTDWVEVIIFTSDYPLGAVHQPLIELTVDDSLVGDAVLIDPIQNISLGDLADVDLTGGAAGDVLTQQVDGSFAMEAPTGGTGGAGGEWGAAVEKTLSGGVLTVTGPGYYKVLAESGTSDALTSISGLSEGDEVILKLADADEIITIKKGEAMLLSSDFILNTTADRLRLQCDGDDKCVELSRASGVFY